MAHLAVTISGHMESIGVTVRLHDLVGDDFGTATVPAPVEIGDLIATEHDEFRVADVIDTGREFPIAALVKVQPISLRGLAARL